MKSYRRVMLGQKSVYAKECFAGNFIGADFGIERDLSEMLYEDWRQFNKELIPEFLKANPEKSRIAAGLACGAIWTVAKGIQNGDCILSPDGERGYRVGEVTGDYYYQPDGILQHRRPVRWTNTVISRDDMSEGLRNSCGSIGTLSDISKHAAEIEKLLAGDDQPPLLSTDVGVENRAFFEMETHLEEFLIRNWSQTDIGKKYDIYEDEYGSGRQYRADGGRMDILAISKDKKTLLVVELKRGRASDNVVGQILRYMGYAKEELAQAGQDVKGVIIALEDDQQIHRALVMVPSIEFYRYEIIFKLVKG